MLVGVRLAGLQRRFVEDCMQSRRDLRTFFAGDDDATAAVARSKTTAASNVGDSDMAGPVLRRGRFLPDASPSSAAVLASPASEAGSFFSSALIGCGANGRALKRLRFGIVLLLRLRRPPAE